MATRAGEMRPPKDATVSKEHVTNERIVRAAVDGADQTAMADTVIVAVVAVNSTDVNGDAGDGRRRRRASTKSVKYADDDGSDEEQAIVVEKKRRARQLDSELRVDVGYPLLEQIVGRRINKRSGATEYLCKFLGRSYLHLWWLTFDELDLFIPEGYQKHHRVQIYERKLRREGYQDLDDVDDVEANKVTIEKILNHKIDPREHLDEQIEKRRRQLTMPMEFPRVTDYFLLDNADSLPERMIGIIKKLMNENGGEIFSQPVDTEEITDYLNIISNPMDLGSIATRLGRESYYVGPSAASLFAADVRLVFDNCKTFNAEGSDIWLLADELLKTFEKWYYDWILCPTAWLKLQPSGNQEVDRKLGKDFREEGEDSYDLWLPWQTGCSICRSNTDSEQLLLCDRCDGEIHMYCSTPELTELPEDEWFCSYCQVRNQFENEAKIKWRETLQGSAESEGESAGVKSETKTDPVSPKLGDKNSPVPNILNTAIDGAKKFNRNTDGKQPTLDRKKDSKPSSVKDRATFFLVKWVGLSIRYSTWERAEDIGDDEQIQRYFKFSRVPTVKEVRETTCQLPCCARRNQLLLNTVAQRCCDKDKFCTRGFQHEGECSREIKTVDKEYGTYPYRHLRMVEQVKAQLYAFHCLLNNHNPDKDVLKQCGVYTNAFVCKKQYLHASLRVQQEDGDEDYSEDENASESSDDDYEDEVDEDDMPFRFRRPVSLLPGVADDDSVEGDDDQLSKKKAEDEVSEVLGALVEHVALGYPTNVEKVVQRVSYNSTYPVSSFQGSPSFTEYCVALRKSSLGLGMRLGVGDDGVASVLGFQRLANGMVGPAEASQVITPGDVLVAVNNVSVGKMVFQDIIGLISRSPDFIIFHLHSRRPAHTYPPFCQPKHVFLQREGVHEDAVAESEYIPFSFNNCKPMLKVGLPSTANSESVQVTTFITPTGPMQHLYAGIVDNSIDPHEHFGSFLPAKKTNVATTTKVKAEKSEFIPYEHSPTFKGGRTLRPYQVEGLNWMITSWKAQRSCILADEMGLGKTVQVVSFIEHLRSEESIRGPYLIVVPLSTIQHWRREIESWTDLNVCVYHDIGDHRAGKFTAKDMRAVIRNQEWYYPGLFGSIFKFHVLLTTFETILADFEEFEHIHWRLVVVDEAHRLKSAGSRVLKQMRSLNTDRKLLLTGTPLQNNTQELWVLLNYLEPVKFDSMDDFNEKFGTLQSQEQVLQLQKLLGPYILRRVKEDVEKSIPPKEETIISVELTTLQKQYYRAIYDKNKSFLYRGTKNSMPTLNNIQLQLRKCCNHPFLIKGVEERELEELGDRPDAAVIMEKTVQCSGKMVLVSKLLPKLKQEGHKVLIFSQFLKQLDLLERYCEANGFGFERLDGTTSGSVRQNAIDRFSRPNSKTFVFLLSTKAGGVGINLIAADTVIIYDSDWNPQNDLQAQARCHRIGQKKSVQIYRLVTRNTYESEMFNRASRKLGLEHAVLGTASFSETSQPDKPTAEQLVELLKRGAYALMEEDDTASKQFAERDIETILKENAHVRVMNQGGDKVEEDESGETKSPKKSRKRKSLAGIAFDRSSFVAEGASNDLSVDDPNFWEKVLPGAMSVEMLSVKLEDGSALASRQSKIKFMSNLDISLNELVEELRNGNEDDSRSGLNLQHEYDIAIQVLHQITTKHKKDFSNDQLDLVKGYLNKLEKSRVRSCRTAPSKKETSQVDDFKKRRKSKSSANGRDASDDEILSSDDDDEDEDEEGTKKAKRSRKKKVVSTRNDASPARSRPSKKRKTPTGFEAPSSMFSGVINDSDDLCTLCGDGGLILLCDGPCHRSFHLECVGMNEEPDDERWLCPDCAAGRHMCLICKQVGEMGVEFGVIQCSVAKCGRFYHKGCLAKHPRVDWVGKKRFRCPSHFCHGCSQEQQLVVASSKKKSSKREPVVGCIHCAQSFHPGCIKSSEQFIRLSTNLMICANHLRPKKPIKAENGKSSIKQESAQTSRNGHTKESVEEIPELEPLDEDVSPAELKKIAEVPALKVCGLCRQGDTTDPEAESSSKRGKRSTKADAGVTSVEGPFIEAPVRLQLADKSTQLVYLHMNCALHSPEVYVKPDGTFCNLQRAIKRGRQLKCTSCKEVGATVGCVVEKCRCNYHLRCAVESGGEFIGSPYTLYCKSHAEENHKEPKVFCTCATEDAEDRGLSLACGSCQMKFHPKCVNMSERQAVRKTKEKTWVCAACTGVATSVTTNATKTNGTTKPKKAKSKQVDEPTEPALEPATSEDNSGRRSSRSRKRGAAQPSPPASKRSRTTKRSTTIHAISPHLDGSDCSISDDE
ncbi:hypothetical protein Poli38472_000680 [Pythium oligandrum]|uniref:Chromodomain-helicase-DNA-binding protein 9 n=1 Tax=Pythium oligandrum TaxID=41045 RepID=A0A8K1CDK1_PYTOL|nr:hypothetical protein Poli38472_000680 [Pythium oligandrum]|eukprot:TMW60638.1 hypothetical protein Poli38472_000680 [Pythium oligandrum]